MTAYGELFRALHDSGARFVVVGGVAVVMHGHARLTIDVDVVVDLEPASARAAVAALMALGLRPMLPVDPMDFADPAVRGKWVEERNLVVFSMHDPDDPTREVDLFAAYPKPFEELYSHAEVMTVDGVPVRVASIEHLIELKRAAGRPRDLDDITALTELLEERDR